VAQLNVQDISELTLATPAYAAVAAADYIIPGASGQGVKYLIHVKNAGASPDNFVIDDPTTTGPPGATAFNPDTTFAVPAGGERMIYVRNMDRFIDPATGRVNFTNSFITTVTIAVFRVQV